MLLTTELEYLAALFAVQAELESFEMAFPSSQAVPWLNGIPCLAAGADLLLGRRDYL